MKKLTIIIFIVLVASSTAYFLFFSGSSGKGEGDAENKEEIFILKTGDIRLLIEATGRVVPEQEVEIKCKASGEITSLPLDVSDTVKKGDILLQLNPEDEKRSVKRAKVALAVSQARLTQSNLNLKVAKRELATEKIRTKAAIASSQAKLTEAKSKLKRVEQLLKKHMASPEELDVARTLYAQAEAESETTKARTEDLSTQAIEIDTKRQEIKIAEAQVEADKISLSDAEQRLADTTVVAPISGIVSENNVQKGQIIASGINNVGGGTTVMTIVDLSRIFILVSVDESDIGHIQNRQRVSITVDAYPDIRFPGIVDRVATKGIIVSNVVTFEVKVEVKGKNSKLLKPGMTANVEITAIEKKDILLVPITAIKRKQHKRFVAVVKADGTTESRAVTTNVTDGVSIEIVSGVQKGDKVIIPATQTQSQWQNDKNNKKDKPHGKRGQMRMMKTGSKKGSGSPHK